MLKRVPRLTILHNKTDVGEEGIEIFMSMVYSYT